LVLGERGTAGRYQRTSVRRRFPPAVPEAGVALDLVEGRVNGAKLVSDSLDCGPHIRPIAIGPASGDEALIVQPVAVSASSSPSK
jgi:hypothetical protein